MFSRNLFYVIGIISSILSILSAVDSSISKKFTNYELCTYLTLAVISLLITCFITRERSSINIKISNRAKLHVKQGDIFSQSNIIVIPVNDFFDTIVDNEVISEMTLHGKLVKEVFKGDVSKLDNSIEEALKMHHGEVVPDRKKGKKTRYPLGTTIKVSHNNKTFFLVAFTRFDSDNRAQITNLEYQETIIKLIDFIENNSNGFQVNMPLLGAGHSGVNTSKQRLLEFLIFSLKMKDNLTLINGINIILDKKTLNDVSLKLVKYYYDIEQ